ncbi:YveK family protein [Paenibacillus sp. KN14-4R]|uniref:YveK family protein n=1 Tax=Paenibacillus sp. KN14-4R TaxID=3445773 RepID=UPI003FA1738A
MESTRKEGNEIDLVGLLRIIMNFKWFLIIIVVISCVGASLFTYYTEKLEYNASIKLVMSRPDTQATFNVEAVNLSITLVNTYKELLRTPAFMDKVVSRHPEWNLTAENMLDKTSVSITGQTPVLSINVSDGSKDRANQMVNSISTAFREEARIIFQVDNIYVLTGSDGIGHTVKAPSHMIRNVGIALIASLLLSIIYVTLRYVMNDTICIEEDLLMLGIKPLASIPEMKKKDMQVPKKKMVIRDQVGEQVNVSTTQ